MLLNRPVFILLLLCLPAIGMGFNLSGQVTRTVSQNIAKNLADNFIKPELRIKNSSGRVLSFTMGRDKKLLAFLLGDGSLRVWDLDLGVQRPSIHGESRAFTCIALDTERQLVYAGHENGSISAYDIVTGQRLYAFPALQQKPVVDMVVSGQGDLLIAYRNGKTALLDHDTHKPKWLINLDDRVDRLASNRDLWAVVLDAENVQIRSLQDGRLLRKPAPLETDIVYLSAADNEDGFVIADQSGALIHLDAASGKIHKQPVITGDMTAVAVSGHHIAVYSKNSEKTIVKSVDSGQIVNLETDGAAIDFLGFTGNGKKLFVIDNEGGVYLFDAGSGKKQLRLISTLQGWTVLDKNGRFDTSEPGLANVSWDVGGTEVLLDKFSDKYYEPGLLATAVGGRELYINKKPAVVEQGVTLPPLLFVHFSEQDAVVGEPLKVQIKATGQGGGVDKIRVYHNGKILGFNSDATEQREVDGRIEKTVTLSVYPTAGENSLSAVATNTMGIESERLQKTLLARAAVKPVGRVLRIVAIGINKYMDPRLNLDYSVADAEAVAKVLAQKKILSIKEVIPKPLFNRQATKQAIIDAIVEAGKYSQNDVLAIYLAGHGIVIDGEWYFLPYEAILQPDASYYAKIGISAKEIKDLLVNVKAQKILLMVDSCYSGAGLSAFNYLLNSQRYMSRNLSRSIGMVVLTAARKNQTAAELTDLGHGLFTYTLTKGMEGGADVQPADRKITAYEIVSFSEKHIPRLSRKYTGASQDPVAFKMGVDFELLRRE